MAPSLCVADTLSASIVLPTRDRYDTSRLCVFALLDPRQIMTTQTRTFYCIALLPTYGYQMSKSTRLKQKGVRVAVTDEKVTRK